MAYDYSRIHRLLKILTLIQGGSGWTTRRLAQECGTTERTIYRDLNMLGSAGIPYFFDRQKNSYTIRRDFFMPPVQMTLEEVLALVALGEQIGGAEQVPHLNAATRAIAKIRGQLPPALQQELHDAEQGRRDPPGRRYTPGGIAGRLSDRPTGPLHAAHTAMPL
jgi:predicted DNA-binding transcriptional regulator YafY